MPVSPLVRCASSGLTGARWLGGSWSGAVGSTPIAFSRASTSPSLRVRRSGRDSWRDRWPPPASFPEGVVQALTRRGVCAARSSHTVLTRCAILWSWPRPRENCPARPCSGRQSRSPAPQLRLFTRRQATGPPAPGRRVPPACRPRRLMRRRLLNSLVARPSCLAVAMSSLLRGRTLPLPSGSPRSDVRHRDNL